MNDPSQLRAGGILAARLGASLCQLADAIEAGDEARKQDIACDLARLLGAFLAFSQAASGMEISPETIPEPPEIAPILYDPQGRVVEPEPRVMIDEDLRKMLEAM